MLSNILGIMRGPFAVALITLVAFLLRASSAHAESEAGSSGGDNQGMFATSVPIETAPYFGIEPRLALTYRSSGGNGWAGVGWSLAGVSTIEPFRAGTSAEGGPLPAPDFYLDGEKLLPCDAASASRPSCASALDAFGSYAGYYFTEREIWTRILHVSDTTPGFANDAWYVWSKSGTLRTYRRAGAKWSGRTGDPVVPWRWVLTEIRDPNQNGVYFHWTRQTRSVTPPGAPAYSQSFFRLDRVQYGPTEVTLYWEDRPDVGERSIGGANYPCQPYGTGTCGDVADGLRGETIFQRIRSIDVKQAGGRARFYQLTYAQGAATLRSQLTRVQMHGKGTTIDAAGGLVSSAIAKQPVQFEYPAATRGSTLHGATATSNSTWPTSYAGTTTGGGPMPKVIPADFDGNGTPDYLVLNGANSNYSKCLNSADFTWSGGSPNCTAHALPYYLSWTTTGEWLAGDFNGDGRTDFLWYDEQTGQNVKYYSDPSPTASPSAALIRFICAPVAKCNAGAGEVCDPSCTFDNIKTGATDNKYDRTRLLLGDFDRDGRTDVLWYHRNGGSSTNSQGKFQKWYSPPGVIGTWNRQPIQAPAPSWTDDDVTAVDLNADRRTDFARLKKGSAPAFKVSASDPAGSGPTPGFLELSSAAADAYMPAAQSQILHCKNPTTGLNYSSDGKWFRDNGGNGKGKFIALDVNGDGLQDLVYIEYSRCPNVIDSRDPYANDIGYRQLVRAGASIWLSLGFGATDAAGNRLLFRIHSAGTPATDTYAGSVNSVARNYCFYPSGSTSDSCLTNQISSSWTWPSAEYRFSPDAPQVVPMDFNGDGKGDLLLYNSRSGRFAKWYGTDAGRFDVQSTQTLGGNSSGRYGGLMRADFNGDLRTDAMLIRRTKNYSGGTADASVQYRHLLADESLTNPYPDLLSRVTNGLGGWQDITYLPTTKFVHDAFFNSTMALYTLRTLTQHDGRGGAYKTTLEFSSPQFDVLNRMFRAFGLVKATSPIGTKTETYYHQGDRLFGAVRATYKKGTNDHVIGYSCVEYGSSGADCTTDPVGTNEDTGPPPEMARLPVRAWEYVCDGSAPSGGICKRTMAENDYDAYGNLTVETHYGDYDATGDEKTLYTYYTYNPASFIVNKPYRTTVGTGAGLISSTTLSYDGQASGIAPVKGNLTQECKWLSSTGGELCSSFVYNTVGNVVETTDPRGGTSSHWYDTSGLMKLGSSNAKQQTAFSVASWDPVCGEVLEERDINDIPTVHTLDGLCRRTRSTYADGSWASVEYIATGDPNLQRVRSTKSESATDGVWEDVYADGMGRTYKTVHEGAPLKDMRVDWTWNTAGQLWKKTPPYWEQLSTPPPGTTYSRYDYDAFGRTVSVTTPEGRQSSTSYGVVSGTACTVATGSGFSNCKMTFEETNDAIGRKSRTYKDAYGNVVETSQWDGAAWVATQHGFDEMRQRVWVSDPEDNTVSFSHDSLGRMIEFSDPNLGAGSKGYDSNGNVICEKDAKGQVIRTDYDELNRPTVRTYCDVGSDCTPTGVSCSGAVRIVTNHYDEGAGVAWPAGHGTSKGKLTRRTDSRSGVEREVSYDLMGREERASVTIDGVSYTTRTTYDLAGRIRTLTQPDGEVLTYTYDKAGRQLTLSGTCNGQSGCISGETAYVSDAGYTNSSQLEDYVSGNGVLQQSQDYDWDGVMTRRWTAGPSTIFQDIDFDHYANGQLQAATDNVAGIETFDYTYDSLGRLATSDSIYNPNWSTSYQYSSSGRLLFKSDLGGDNAYEYPSQGSGTLNRPHAPTRAGPWTMDYDANGNLVSGAGRQYTYDEDNRPTSISVSVGQGEPGGAPSYVGCWGDNPVRALPVEFGSGHTIESCQQAVQAAGLKFAGLQYYGSCFGGDELGYSLLPESECNTPCNANPAQMCGGGWRNSVYQVEGVPPAATYEGCYTDDASRALPQFFGEGHTVESCLYMVEQAGLAYAGLQYYGQCFGGDELGYSSAPESECNTPCGANPAETCGGAWRNSVHRLVAQSGATFATGEPALSGTTSYVYDGAGQRIKTVGPDGSTTISVHPGYEIRDGQVVKYYSFGGRMVARVHGSGIVEWVITDRQGGVQQLVSANGQQLLKDQVFLPFGRSVAVSDVGPGPRERHGYTAHSEDPTGLLFMKARYYDPVTGLFVQPDSLRQIGNQQLNPYAYAQNDPVNLIDPSGHFAQALAIAVGHAIGAAAVSQIVNGFFAQFDDPALAAFAGLANIAATGAFMGPEAMVSAHVGQTMNLIGSDLGFGAQLAVQTALIFMQGGGWQSAVEPTVSATVGHVCGSDAPCAVLAAAAAAMSSLVMEAVSPAAPLSPSVADSAAPPQSGIEQGATAATASPDAAAAFGDGLDKVGNALSFGGDALHIGEDLLNRDARKAWGAAGAEAYWGGNSKLSAGLVEMGDRSHNAAGILRKVGMGLDVAGAGVDMFSAGYDLGTLVNDAFIAPQSMSQINSSALTLGSGSAGMLTTAGIILLAGSNPAGWVCLCATGAGVLVTWGVQTVGSR